MEAAMSQLVYGANAIIIIISSIIIIIGNSALLRFAENEVDKA
jgi:hypothetical protein